MREMEAKLEASTSAKVENMERRLEEERRRSAENTAKIDKIFAFTQHSLPSSPSADPSPTQASSPPSKKARTAPPDQWDSDADDVDDPVKEPKARAQDGPKKMGRPPGSRTKSRAKSAARSRAKRSGYKK